MSHKNPAPELTIRYARPDDAPAIARLAVLDSQPVPAGALLVGEVGGELWAALSLTGQGSIADPFRPSADVTTLLRARAAQLRRTSAPAAFEPAPASLRTVVADG